MSRWGETASRERGSLLLDTLLAVGILSGLAIFTGQMLSFYHDGRKEEAAAAYVSKVHKAAEAMAATPDLQSAARGSGASPGQWRSLRTWCAGLAQCWLFVWLLSIERSLWCGGADGLFGNAGG